MKEFFKKKKCMPKNIIKIKGMGTVHAMAAAGLETAFVSELLISYCGQEQRGVYYVLKDCLPDKFQVGFVVEKAAIIQRLCRPFFIVIWNFCDSRFCLMYSIKN